MSPTMCIACRESYGPYVDLLVTLPTWGHAYLCARCTVDAGREIEMLAAEDAAKLDANIRTLDAALESTRAELEREKAEKFIRLEDARKILSDRIPVSEGSPR